MRIEYIAVSMILFLVVLVVVVSFASGALPAFTEFLRGIGFG